MVTASVAEAAEQVYDRIMAVNAKGTSSPFQQATRRLRDGDRIINISTVNTVLPVPRGEELSAASKAPVQQATLVAARELADPGITINTISPSCPIARWSTAPTTGRRRADRHDDSTGRPADVVGSDSGVPGATAGGPCASRPRGVARAASTA